MGKSNQQYPMIQIVKKPSGARLVISIIILMSRWRPSTLWTWSTSSSVRFLYLSSPVSPLYSILPTIYSYNNRFWL